jgi:benzoate 4-monooxygenase
LGEIAVVRVLYRLESKQDSERVDLLVRLIQGKDETGAKLGREELTAEALIQLIAASDTISNTSCTILFCVIKIPGVVAKLQEELDLAFLKGTDILTYKIVKDLVYL